MSKRVLAIDDERLILSFIKRGLEKVGYDVHTASDKDEALNLLEANSYDLVLADVVLPGLKEGEVIDLIKQRWPETKVIVITGKASSITADGFLEKPFMLEELRRLVSSAIGDA